MSMIDNAKPIYTKADQVAKTMSEKKYDKTLWHLEEVVVPLLNVREKPDIESEVNAVMANGEMVYVSNRRTGCPKGWKRIDSAIYGTGYCVSDGLKSI